MLFQRALLFGAFASMAAIDSGISTT